MRRITRPRIIIATGFLGLAALVGAVAASPAVMGNGSPSASPAVMGNGGPVAAQLGSAPGVMGNG